MRFYGVISGSAEETVELSLNRRESERIVENWDRDEPEDAGALRIETIELETSPN